MSEYAVFTDEEVSNIVVSIPADVQKDMRRKYVIQKACDQHERATMELSFNQWAAIWWSSGHWNERGRGTGCFHMCRKDDAGTYSMGNIRIDSSETNIAEREVTAEMLSNLAMGPNKLKKTVIGTNVLTGVETEYESAHEAARELKCDRANISRAAKMRKSAYGHTWRFTCSLP